MEDPRELFQGSTFSIAQTSDGFLWLGTEIGFSRLGITFMNMGDAEYTSLKIQVSGPWPIGVRNTISQCVRHSDLASLQAWESRRPPEVWQLPRAIALATAPGR